MVIRADDRIADILARDAKLLEVLVEASPHFERLKNPAMRRVMARLVTVEQAARIAGVDPADLVRRLNAAIAPTSVGIERYEETAPATSSDAPRSHDDPSDASLKLPPALSRLPADRIVDLDVRDDLRSGREPFSRIMAARASLPAGSVLRLRAIFEPVPLYGVMARQGFAYWTEKLAEDDWRVWFYRETHTGAGTVGARGSTAPTDARRPIPDSPRDVAPAGAMDAAAHERRDPAVGKRGTSPVTAGPRAADSTAAANIIVLDVRGLDPPEPMVRTLAALESLPRGSTLLHINVRVPEFLLPRLDDLGFRYEIRPQGPDLVRVFIRHGDQNRADNQNGAAAGAPHRS